MTCNDVEFQLPPKLYDKHPEIFTCFTRNKHPHLVNGADIFIQMKTWQGAAELLSHDLMIYPLRDGSFRSRVIKSSC